MSSVLPEGIFYILPSFLSKLYLLCLMQALDTGQVPPVSLDVNQPGAGGAETAAEAKLAVH